MDEHVQTESRWAMGVAATAGWAAGAGAAPLTRREDTPLSWELVRTEWWAAQVAIDEAPDAAWDPAARPVARQEVGSLGVAWVDPVRCHSSYAVGVWRTLRWMLGSVDQRVPLLVPLRHPDGSLLSAEDLYAQAIAEQPWRYRLPEHRNELRHEAHRRYRRSQAAAQRVQTMIDRARGRTQR